MTFQDFLIANFGRTTLVVVGGEQRFALQGTFDPSAKELARYIGGPATPRTGNDFTSLGVPAAFSGTLAERQGAIPQTIADLAKVGAFGLPQAAVDALVQEMVQPNADRSQTVMDTVYLQAWPNGPAGQRWNPVANELLTTWTDRWLGAQRATEAEAAIKAAIAHQAARIEEYYRDPTTRPADLEGSQFVGEGGPDLLVAATLDAGAGTGVEKLTIMPYAPMAGGPAVGWWWANLMRTPVAGGDTSHGPVPLDDVVGVVRINAGPLSYLVEVATMVPSHAYTVAFTQRRSGVSKRWAAKGLRVFEAVPKE